MSRIVIIIITQIIVVVMPSPILSRHNFHSMVFVLDFILQNRSLTKTIAHVIICLSSSGNG